MKRVVFTDTNALVALICFPEQKGQRLSLPQEVALAEATGECEFFISDVVAEELREVVTRAFPNSIPALETFLSTFEVNPLPKPSKKLLKQLVKLCKDPDDVPVLAAALQSADTHGATHLLPNDIETFHSDGVKEIAAKHGMKVVTLYGLLKEIGWR
jgi:predicted nucleic acid-binding protein